MRRGEGKSLLLELASKACLVLAVFLFVTHHPWLAGAAVVGSFALSGLSGRASEDGRIDEALAAKAEWDRLHPPEESSEDLPSWKRPRTREPDPAAPVQPPDDAPRTDP